MKHLKYFEDIDREPKVGDYVICEEDFSISHNDSLTNFINNNIGRIGKIDYNHNEPYMIEYNNIPNDITYAFPMHDKYRGFGREEIIFFSNNKEDLESILQAKKYNI